MNITMLVKSISLRSINNYLIYVGLFILPIFGMKEYLFTIDLYTPDYSNPLSVIAMTSPLVKGIKDLLLAILLMNLFAYIMLSKKPASLKIPNGIVLAFILYLTAQAGGMLARTNIFITLISIRSFLPLLFIFIAYYFINKAEMKKIGNIIIIMACVEVLLGAIQFTFGRLHYGVSPLGFGARISGTFFICQSMGMFLLLGCIFLLAEECMTKRHNILLSIFALFIILTGSATSIIGLLSAILIKNFFKAKRMFSRDAIIAVMLLLLPLFIVILPDLSGRGNAIYNASGYNRLKILFGLFDAPNTVYDILVGHGIGYGSNFTILASISGHLQQNTAVKAFGTDSFYTSFISQIGVIGLALIMMVNLSAWYKAYKSGFMLGIIMVPVLLIAGFSAMFTEHFPINWVYPIVLGYIFKQHNNGFEK